MKRRSFVYLGAAAAASGIQRNLLAQGPNDQIRVAILGARDSPGPGVFGGAIVDVDRRRGRIGEEGGQGRDRFAEMFSLANLIVPDPTKSIDDGAIQAWADPVTTRTNRWKNSWAT